MCHPGFVDETLGQLDRLRSTRHEPGVLGAEHFPRPVRCRTKLHEMTSVKNRPAISVETNLIRGSTTGRHKAPLHLPRDSTQESHDPQERQLLTIFSTAALQAGGTQRDPACRGYRAGSSPVRPMTVYALRAKRSMPPGRALKRATAASGNWRPATPEDEHANRRVHRFDAGEGYSTRQRAGLVPKSAAETWTAARPRTAGQCCSKAQRNGCQ